MRYFKKIAEFHWFRQVLCMGKKGTKKGTVVIVYSPSKFPFTGVS
jgi:hypothetical protein